MVNDCGRCCSGISSTANQRSSRDTSEHKYRTISARTGTYAMVFMPRIVKNGISCDNNLLIVFKVGLMHALVTVP